ncbi:hypothetical protein [Radiobacillus sp. PE A8.2]|uniref:hypothetical protein n=1 Tax=Radiobacillus sp. PE A8.2 TaxID=3380349 RepID=UPI00388F1164
MSSQPVLTQDVHWNINGTNYVIRNVPYFTYDNDDEKLLDLDVSITMTALKDLMVQGKMPKDINFENFAHIKF